MPNNSPLKKSKNIWSGLPITYRGAIIIAIPAICLISTLVAWGWLRQVRISLNEQIEHQEKTIHQSNQLLLNLLNAETGVRGYIINHKSEYLEPYQLAISKQGKSLESLKELTSKDFEQQQTLQKIEKLVYKELGTLEQIITLIKQDRLQNKTTTQEIVLLSEAKKVMDELRVLLAALETKEQSLLNLEKQNLKNLEEIIVSVHWIASLASIIAYVGAVCLFRQIDGELGEREQQLKKSKTLIEAITTNVIDSIVTLNREGKIETFNLAAAKMFGYEITEIMGQEVAVLLADPLHRDQQERINFLHPILLSLNKPWETIGYQKSGQPFPIEISVSQIDSGGLFISIIRDISEREEAKAKLQARANELAELDSSLARANLALEKKNQELEKFTYIASHDLKAPLRAIFSLSEWLEEDLQDTLSEENKQLMKLLRMRVYRLEALINGLLAYSRIGRINVTIQTLSIGELLQNIIDCLTPPVAFRFKISPEMPTLTTKKTLLRQVFFNLIENAIKHHHRQDGYVQIDVEEVDGFYQFAVTDNGPGIAPLFQKRIFVLLQTLESRDVKENTGVGLSVAKKIVETEGGKIWLNSQEGAGSTFYFTWPKESTTSKQFALTASMDYRNLLQGSDLHEEELQLEYQTRSIKDSSHALSLKGAF